MRPAIETVWEDSQTESKGKAAKESSACGAFVQTLLPALEVSHVSVERQQLCNASSTTLCGLINIIGFIKKNYNKGSLLTF